MITLPIIFFVINLHVILGQNEVLTCRYFKDDTYGYTCDLNIRNANGVNNMTNINGIHLIDHGDSDVKRIFSYANRSSSLNVPSIICEKFSNIRTIFLREIAIQQLDNYSFNGCINATIIDLPNNRILNVDEKTFINNPELQTLFLNNNNLTALPEQLLEVHSDLVYLSLAFNKIIDLPRNIFRELRNLKELNLGSNLLTNLKIEWFRSLSSLEILYLNTNQIVELPSFVFINSKNLKRIDLYSNRLMILHSDSFGVLLKLTTISVYTNSINFIDERLIDNTEVSLFDVRSNICANVQSNDASAARNTMRTNLRSCLNNYLNLVSICRHQKMIPPDDNYPFECTTGDWDERICSLEEQSEKFENTILSEIRSENQKILGLLEDINARLTDLENRPSACNQE